MTLPTGTIQASFPFPIHFSILFSHESRLMRELQIETYHYDGIVNGPVHVDFEIVPRLQIERLFASISGLNDPARLPLCVSSKV